MTSIILGPPGTGKTTTLLDIVDAALSRGTPPDRVAYLSFTRRAAEEAVTRASAKFGLTPKQLPHFRTLHSLCFRALGLSNTDVFEGPKVREFADWAGIRLTGRRVSEDGTMTGFEQGDRILFLENLARVRCLSLRQQYDADDDSLPWGEVQRVAQALRLFKQSKGLLDFTDMLAEFVRLGQPPDLDELIVDEAQDNSSLQWRVVRLLATRAGHVTVAGDDDQALYRWAGADAALLVDLEGEARVLGQSYRVPAAVQVVAEAIISPVAHRRPKRWAPRPGEGGVSLAMDLGELDLSQAWAEDVQPVLVLARNTYIIRDQVEPELRRMGVLYEWHDRRSLSPQMVDAVVSWEHLRAGGTVTADAARGALRYVTPGQGLAHRGELPGVPGDALVVLGELVRDHGLLTTAIWHEALDRLPPDDVAYIIAARQRGERLAGRPRVRLSTVHASKGGEARHVVLFREMARRTHDEMLASEDDERRVWYTAVTRARERLTVVEGKRMEVCPWV